MTWLAWLFSTRQLHIHVYVAIAILMEKLFGRKYHALEHMTDSIHTSKCMLFDLQK